MGELKVLGLKKVREDCADEGGDGFDDEEKDGVDCWKLEIWRRHSCCCACRSTVGLQAGIFFGGWIAR